jgi:dienelactone hydrolase
VSRLQSLGIAILAAIACLAATAAAWAQSEFPPPQGKGPVVIVVSGQAGADRYQPMAKQVAALGYDAVLVDGNDMEGSHGQALRAAVEAAQHDAHGLPGRVGVVGFSLGGGEALAYATRWPDLVAAVVAWYPATSSIRNIQSFVRGLKVPALVFAGGMDRYKNCCLIETAEKLAATASASGAPLQVVTYDSAQHDFVFPGRQYDPAAASDSWQRAADQLRRYLGH